MTKNQPQLRKAASTAGMSRSYRAEETHDSDFVIRPRQSMSFDRRVREVLNEIPEEHRQPRPNMASDQPRTSQPRPVSYLGYGYPYAKDAGINRPVYHGSGPHPDATVSPIPSWNDIHRIPSMNDNSLEEEQAPPPPPRPPKQPLPKQRKSIDPEDYAKPFCDFLTDNPTIFHAVKAVADDLKSHGYEKLSERDSWKLKKGGKYFVERNGSSLIAFAVGDNYEAGNGAAILAGHIDALTAKGKSYFRLCIQCFILSDDEPNVYLQLNQYQRCEQRQDTYSSE
jgi:aminopeptidase I